MILSVRSEDRKRKALGVETRPDVQGLFLWNFDRVTNAKIAGRVEPPSLKFKHESLSAVYSGSQPNYGTG